MASAWRWPDSSDTDARRRGQAAARDDRRDARHGECNRAGVINSSAPLRRLARAAVPLTSLCLALACSANNTTDAARSPTLDYTDPPRTANDGEPIGANRQDPADTLAGSATTAHLAPGWKIEDGKLRRESGRARGMHDEPGADDCVRDAGAPAVDDEREGAPQTRRCPEPAP